MSHKQQQKVTTTKAMHVSKRHQRITTISPTEMQESQTQDMASDKTSVSTDVTMEEIQRYFFVKIPNFGYIFFVLPEYII